MVEDRVSGVGGSGERTEGIAPGITGLSQSLYCRNHISQKSTSVQVASA